MTTLEELDTEFGRITIVQSDEDGSISYYQGDCLQSRMNDEGVSACVYVHIIHSIIRQSKAKHILMIGCAGGTLASMLHDQGYKVTLVDINPHAFRLARQYFDMPSNIECFVQDGVTYLQEAGRQFDAIVIDAFANEVKVPESFSSDSFFKVAKDALNPFGALIMNIVVADDNDDSAECIALNMRLAGLDSVLFDWPGKNERNTIVAAGTVDHIQVKPHILPKFIRNKLEGLTRRLPKKLVMSVG